MLERYAAMMARGRQNTILVPLEVRKGEDGHITLNRKRLQRFVDLFTRHGFYYIEGRHLARAEGSKLKTGIGKHLVQSRFKRAGMRWKTPGFLSVVELRVARLNGTDGEFWASRGLAGRAAA